MSYTRSTRNLPLRDEALPYDEVGPGLYEDEDLFELDTGELVAVSQQIERDASTGGIVVIAWWRVVKEDGSTDLSAGEMEYEHRLAVDGAVVEEHGSGPIVRAVLLAMLGEPQEPDAPPVIDPAVARNISVRTHLASRARAAEPARAGELLNPEGAA
jgi:hypothetical protein